MILRRIQQWQKGHVKIHVVWSKPFEEYGLSCTKKKNLPRTDTIFILITRLLFILQTYSPFYYFITYFRELLFNGYYLEKLSWFFQIRNGTSVDIVRMSYKIGVIR